MSTDTSHLPAAQAERAIVEITPANLLEMAVSQGADLDRLERLMDLKERWDKEQNRKAYYAAFVAFKATPLTVTKDRTVSYSGTFFTHASLENLTDTIAPALAEHGLSHGFDVGQDQDGTISVICRLSHQDGHSESVTLSGAPDDSGKKNPLQQVGSTIKYLSRYTLMAITGLSPEDPDEPKPVTEPHVTNSATEVNPLEADTLYEGTIMFCEERQKRGGKGTYGFINIQTDLGVVEMRFFERPEGIKDLDPKDWHTLEKKRCIFAFSASEKNGRIWRNLETLDMLDMREPAPQTKAPDTAWAGVKP